MRVSVVIPTLDEQEQLPACLERVRQQDPPPHEILVADGGSSDGTRDCALGVRWVDAPRGRGRQLNAAAARATGEALLFLHADARLPAGGLAALTAALEDASVAGGAFHKRWRSSHPFHRWPRWRTALWHRFGAVFGDQAIFVRSALFEELGGFREDLLAEDADFIRRLRGRGRVRLLDLEVEISARRLREDGTLRTWRRWWAVWLRELWATRRTGDPSSPPS